MAGGYEQKDMTGSLFKNTDKQSDNHPDYNGSIMVDGKPFWLNAWLKTAKNGTKYMSLSLKPKEKRAQQGGDRGGRGDDRDSFQGGGGRQQSGAPQRTNWERDLKDDVPF